MKKLMIMLSALVVSLQSHITITLTGTTPPDIAARETEATLFEKLKAQNIAFLKQSANVGSACLAGFAGGAASAAVDTALSRVPAIAHTQDPLIKTFKFLTRISGGIIASENVSLLLKYLELKTGIKYSQDIPGGILILNLLALYLGWQIGFNVTKTALKS